MNSAWEIRKCDVCAHTSEGVCHTQKTSGGTVEGCVLVCVHIYCRCHKRTSTLIFGECNIFCRCHAFPTRAYHCRLQGPNWDFHQDTDIVSGKCNFISMAAVLMDYRWFIKFKRVKLARCWVVGIIGASCGFCGCGEFNWISGAWCLTFGLANEVILLVNA